MRKIDEVSMTKREMAVQEVKELLMLQEKLEFAVLDTCPDKGELLDQIIAKNRKQIRRVREMLQIVNLMQDLGD